MTQDVAFAERLADMRRQHVDATSGLSRAAREQLRGAGMTPDAWARSFGRNGQWRGAPCGCPDDRCAGEHHGLDEPCRCLTALLAVAAAKHGAAVATALLARPTPSLVDPQQAAEATLRGYVGHGPGGEA